MEREDIKERRKSKRLKIQIWAEEKRGNSVYYHLLTNLSKHGLFIEKKLPFPVGHNIELELKLPDSDEKIVIRGHIVGNYQGPSSDNMGAGLKFTDVDQGVVERIIKFLEEYEL